MRQLREIFRRKLELHRSHREIARSNVTLAHTYCPTGTAIQTVWQRRRWVEARLRIGLPVEAVEVVRS